MRKLDTYEGDHKRKFYARLMERALKNNFNMSYVFIMDNKLSLRHDSFSFELEIRFNPDKVTVYNGNRVSITSKQVEEAFNIINNIEKYELLDI